MMYWQFASIVIVAIIFYVVGYVRGSRSTGADWEKFTAPIEEERDEWRQKYHDAHKDHIDTLDEFQSWITTIQQNPNSQITVARDPIKAIQDARREIRQADAVAMLRKGTSSKKPRRN